MTPTIIVTRHPDHDNDFAIFDGDVTIHDIDMGRSDLGSSDELMEWATSHLDDAEDHPSDARRAVYEIIAEQVAESGALEGIEDDETRADAEKLKERIARELSPEKTREINAEKLWEEANPDTDGGGAGSFEELAKHRFAVLVRNDSHRWLEGADDDAGIARIELGTQTTDGLEVEWIDYVVDLDTGEHYPTSTTLEITVTVNGATVRHPEAPAS